MFISRIKFSVNPTSLLGCPFDDLFHTAAAASSGFGVPIELPGWSVGLFSVCVHLGGPKLGLLWSVGDYRRDKPMTKPQRAEGRAGNWRAPLL